MRDLTKSEQEFSQLRKERLKSMSIKDRFYMKYLQIKYTIQDWCKK